MLVRGGNDGHYGVCAFGFCGCAVYGRCGSGVGFGGGSFGLCDGVRATHPKEALMYLHPAIFNTLNALDSKKPKAGLALVPMSGESVFAPTDNGRQTVLVPLPLPLKGDKHG